MPVLQRERLGKDRNARISHRLFVSLRNTVFKPFSFVKMLTLYVVKAAIANEPCLIEKRWTVFILKWIFPILLSYQTSHLLVNYLIVLPAPVLHPPVPQAILVFDEQAQ